MSIFYLTSLVTPKERIQDGSLYILDSFKLSMEVLQLFLKKVPKK